MHDERRNGEAGTAQKHHRQHCPRVRYKRSPTIVRMFELREETRHLRERLTQLDNERLAAASLAQRSSLIQKRRELLAQMGKAF